MTDDIAPLLYFVLGAAGSGRREVLLDLMADGLTDEDRPAVLVAADEQLANDATEARLATAAKAGLARWSFTPGDVRNEVPPVITAEVPVGATHVFLVANGRRNPIDQLEALRPWIEQAGVRLARILCVVDCQRAERHPALLAWYDACVHFSDVVLLNRRDGVANKWISGFEARYRDQFFPCLIELVKNGRVKNPVALLLPESRRITHTFEDEPDWIVADTGEDIEMGSELEDDEDAAKKGSGAKQDDEEEVEIVEALDPYFQRRPGGRRLKEIPDIAEFLG